MHHRRLRRAVEAYVDGQLRSAERISEVRAHLDDCWGCSSDAEVLRMMKRSLARLTERRPPHLTVARLRQWAEEALL